MKKIYFIACFAVLMFATSANARIDTLQQEAYEENCFDTGECTPVPLTPTTPTTPVIPTTGITTTPTVTTGITGSLSLCPIEYDAPSGASTPCTSGYYKSKDTNYVCKVCPDHASCSNGCLFTCDDGYAKSSSGTSCAIEVELEQVCLPNEYKWDGECVTLNCAAACGAGYTFTDYNSHGAPQCEGNSSTVGDAGSCKANGHCCNPACPAGQERVNGVCTLTAGPECSSGEELVGGVCQTRTTVSSCPSYMTKSTTRCTIK